MVLIEYAPHKPGPRTPNDNGKRPADDDDDEIVGAGPATREAKGRNSQRAAVRHWQVDLGCRPEGQGRREGGSRKKRAEAGASNAGDPIIVNDEDNDDDTMSRGELSDINEDVFTDGQEKPVLESVAPSPANMIGLLSG
ncbi:hypothetical protein LA080_002677 [Diaporthe eres]|nr:hypothetical protein LA080_002677 [Diaporthe eres]